MDDKYLNRKMVGWLSYNPNFESRDAQSRNNKVCYFYPRYLLQNGSYQPIDSKTDFPQVGRIAVWIQGGDDAESVTKRYGNLVTATLNRALECNYESNNYYTARYNYDYGPKSSEIWLATVDATAFYEVVESFASIDNISNIHQIDLPANFSGSTKYILLNNHRVIYGPFAYSLQKGKLHLQGVSGFDFLVGEYNAPTLERKLVVIRDNMDADTVALLPTEHLTPNPAACKAKYDLIDNEDLLNQFLEQTKVKLNLSRKDFREIKDYITRIIKDDNAVDFTNNRLQRLRKILPKIFDVQNHVLDTFTSIMTDPELSQVIVQELLKKYPDTLKASLASAVGVGYTANASDGADSSGSTMKDIPLSVESLPYSVINSFFSNEQMKNLVDILQNTSQQLADKIEQVHEGNQILNSPSLELEDLISTPNFYPDYRAQLIGELDALYQCLDNITSFLDLILGRDANDKTNNSPAAGVLNELSIRLSRVKERLTRRKQLLESDITADQIDLTLDELQGDNSTEISQMHCTLADVLKNARLLTHHSLAPVQRECNHLKQVYKAADDAIALSKQIADLTATKEDLEKQIAELDSKKNEQEDAVKNISTDFKQILSPIKDQYQLAAKLLDHSLMQSALPAPATVILAAPQNGAIPVIAGSQANVGVVIQTTAQAVAAPNDEIASTPENTAETVPMTNLAGRPIQVPAAKMANVEDESNIPSDVDNSAPLSEKPIDLNPLFNVDCLDDPAKFDTRKQFIDMLSVFFNRHASRNISNNELANYLICITQGFITTFAGEPGTGKTSLCNLLARSLGLVREDQNNRFVEISVERGWTSLKDFIGYYNPLSKRMEKSNSEVFDAFFELNKEARALKGNANSENFLTTKQLAPYFILLDEANLSPIEHYWAAFFRNCDDIVRQQRSISLGGKANWYLPENLRFLATINIDHTTEELSARFLDRSWVITLDPQTIDFNSPEANEDLLTKDKIVPFECLKKAFTPNSDDKLPKDLANKWQEIQEIFSSSECAMPIRPRNLKMVYNYCLVASGCMNCHGDNGRLAPLDYAISQKILPTINGNGERYKLLIDKLYDSCNKESMPLCAKHLERMKRAGNADLGFYQFFSR